LKCDRCDNEVIQTFRSTGQTELCHQCAHDLGLLHVHRDEAGKPDPDVEGSTHFLDGFFSKEEIEAHIEAFKEKTG